MTAQDDMQNAIPSAVAPPAAHSGSKVGLVLSGGGARVAYQVGVLKALADLLPAQTASPFSVVTGVSAGAINAVALASHAENFRLGVRRLHHVWYNFQVSQVYRSTWGSIFKTTGHWLLAMLSAGMGKRNPVSLLDNQPLRELLQKNIRFGGIQKAIDAGCLEALAVTASSYDSARAVTFFQAHKDYQKWMRSRREGRRVDVNVEHMMASVAVPFVFPPNFLDGEFYGDGALRGGAPLSPAVKLGADRLLVIGARDEVATESREKPDDIPPSFGQIAGYLLDTIFLDGLYFDLERLTRINQLVAQAEVPLQKRPGRKMKRIATMIMVPSMDVRELAARHAHEFPKPIRVLLGGVGAGGETGRQLKSYLLFERAYCRSLIHLGYHDCMRQREEILPFVQGEPVDDLIAPAYLKRQLEGQSKD